MIFGVQQAVTIYADAGEIVWGDVEFPKDGGSIYAEKVPGFVVDVNDGKPHRWQRVIPNYDLTFDKCVMTIKRVDEVSTFIGVGMNGDAPEECTLLYINFRSSAL